MSAPLQRRRSTPLQPGSDSGAIRQIDRRLHSSDVNLLPKYKLKEFALRAAIDGDDLCRADAGDRLHDLLAAISGVIFR